MTVCPACGEPNPARASFCLACGASLPPPDVAVRPARKTVTVVFTDVLHALGRGEEAARLAGGAVTIAGPTDMLAMRGDALLDLAAVAAAAGRDGDAAEAASAALELYLAKGNLPGAARARVAVAAVRTRSASRAAADA
jgi:Double zinc ribbon